MFAKRFAGLKPYVPGEQPTDRAYIKLNANENPYPPPRSREGLRDFDRPFFSAIPILTRSCGAPSRTCSAAESLRR